MRNSVGGNKPSLEDEILGHCLGPEVLGQISIAADSRLQARLNKMAVCKIHRSTIKI